MRVNVSARDSIETERILLTLILGLTTALERNVINIEEAENFLFSPYSMEKLKKAGVNESIIDLIHLGTELENVERLIPDKLSVSIEEIKESALKALQKMPKSTIPIKKWIDVDE